MVQFDAGEHVFQLFHRPQNVCTLGGVGFHDLEFFGSQGARFFQNAIFNADFAYVVQLR